MAKEDCNSDSDKHKSTLHVNSFKYIISGILSAEVAFFTFFVLGNAVKAISDDKALLLQLKELAIFLPAGVVSAGIFGYAVATISYMNVNEAYSNILNLKKNQTPDDKTPLLKKSTRSYALIFLDGESGLFFSASYVATILSIVITDAFYTVNALTDLLHLDKKPILLWLSMVLGVGLVGSFVVGVGFSYSLRQSVALFSGKVSVREDIEKGDSLAGPSHSLK